MTNTESFGVLNDRFNKWDKEFGSNRGHVKVEAYLNLLAKDFDSRQKIITELINLEAILHLPKGTELYISDIHGEYDGFDHILRTCAGNVQEKINDCFNVSLSLKERQKLTVLIAYPDIVMAERTVFEVKDEAWYRQTIDQLLQLLIFVSSKYTRSKVRKLLPTQYAYVIEELIYSDKHLPDKENYFYTVLDYLIDLREGKQFIIALADSIRTLIIDHIHIIGDIYDRGTGADLVMDSLMENPEIDIQWGNHDILWMGAFCGSKECLLTLLRIAARYNYLFDIEKAYGLNLRPLFLFAEKAYDHNPLFQPKKDNKPRLKLSDNDLTLLEKVHQALSIIQFKLEGQLIKRRPEFNMADSNVLEHIDYEQLTITVKGKTYPLEQTCFQTIDPSDPLTLTPEEEQVVSSLLESFQHSVRLKEHITFLMDKGGMYLKYNGHLLFHGCIPMLESGEFMPLTINGKSYKGKGLLDFFDYHIRKSQQDPCISDDLSTDLIWYCWCGPISPLFGKDRMTTFERYFIKDKETHQEIENVYFKFRNQEEACLKILAEFGLTSSTSRIVNGHTPVKTLQGESPIRGNGLLFVIDGGLSKAYQPKTGIAGYSLLNNSYGFQIVTHQPFLGVPFMLEHLDDSSSLKKVIDQIDHRLLIEETTIGDELLRQKDQLLALLATYQKSLALDERFEI